MFVSYSVAEHVRSDDLILIVDGKRMQATTPRPSWSTGEDGAGHPIEHINFSISTKDLLRIARAKKVEGKLGQATFKLNNDNLAAMPALASEMGLFPE